MWRPGCTGPPSTWRSNNSAASRPRRARSWVTVDRLGETSAASGSSSKPTTAWSRGSCSPAALRTFMVPTAFRSVAAKTAVDGTPAASSALPAVPPPSSRLLSAGNNRSGSGCRPWSNRAPGRPRSVA